MHKKASSFFLVACCSVGMAFGQAQGGMQPISVELGGSVSFAYAMSGSKFNSTLYLEPVILKYFSSLFIGPVLGLSDNWGTYQQTTQFYLLGVQCGTLIGSSGRKVLPYISLGLAREWISPRLSTLSAGTAVPAVLGIKIRLGTSAIFDYGIAYTFANVESVSSHSLGTGFGISICR